MVIFRIIFNLFRLITGMGFRLLWLPVFLVTRNLFLLIIVAVLVLAYVYFSDQPPAPARDANPTTMTRDPQGREVQVATPVRRVEDGNSAFSNDLYAQMTDQEKSYYSQIFFWAMGNLAPAQTHSWSQVDISGAIRVDESFKNNTGTDCKRFSETLKVHAVQQQLNGIACREADGQRWCKLTANATPACGLGHTPGLLDGISGAIGKIF